MIKETQQLIIICLTIIGIICILKNYEATTILATIVGILGGFLMGKKFVVDPNEQKIIKDESGEDV